MFPPVTDGASGQSGLLADPLSTFPSTFGSMRVKEANLKINNHNYRNNNFETQIELYNELRQYQLGNGYVKTQGAAISFNDFTHGMGLHLFDVSRHPSVLNNLPITFTFTGQLINPAGSGIAAGTAVCAPIFLVERYCTAFINISRSEATTDAKDGLVAN
jgi:hypothetical protein